MASIFRLRHTIGVRSVAVAHRIVRAPSLRLGAAEAVAPAVFAYKFYCEWRNGERVRERERGKEEERRKYGIPSSLQRHKTIWIFLTFRVIGKRK